MTIQPPSGDPGSCSALAGVMRVEAARLAECLEELRSRAGTTGPGRGAGVAAGAALPGAVAELSDLVADLEVLADALQQHAMAQLEARRLPPGRAASLEGRGRHAVLRASRRIRRLA